MGTTNRVGGSPERGIYVLTGGQTQLVASTATVLPDPKGPDTFGCLEDPQLVRPQDGFSTAVAFFGSDCGHSIEAKGRMFRTRHSQSHALKVGQIHAGIWLAQRAVSASGAWSILPLADKTIPVPGGTTGETFFALSAPGTAGASSSVVGFIGLGNNGTLGVFAWSDGKLQVVAIAKRDGSCGLLFSDFPEPPSVHGSRILFLAGLSDGSSGVFAVDLSSSEDGSWQLPRFTYQAIITEDTKLDGDATIDYLGFGRDAIYGDTSAVYMVLSNGTYGVFLVHGAAPITHRHKDDM